MKAQPAVGGAAGDPSREASVLQRSEPVATAPRPAAGPARFGAELAPLTTLRLGGPAAELVEARTEADVVAAVRGADAAGVPVLLLGGGSSVVVSDAGWPGLVVLLRTAGCTVGRDRTGVTLTIPAGEPWDDVVAFAVTEGWTGLEFLSGIPGRAGAAVVENVAAYGQELADTVTTVRALDRGTGEVLDLPAPACRFGYRDSAFLRSGRYVVLAVTLRLRPSAQSAPIGYEDVAAALDLPVGAVAGLGDIRAAVLELRRRAGRIVDPGDPDTWTAGSFFSNPILPPAELDRFVAGLDPAASYPSWPAVAGTKLSAAWLVRQCGFAPGHGGERVLISPRHPLSLVHRGGGSTAELVALAREIRAAVHDRFGITLPVQPRLIGVEL